jgi:hypothetical protein
VTVRLSHLLTAAVVAIQPSCEDPPPDLIPRYEEPRIYGQVLKVARRKLGIDVAVAIHPFLAIVQDTQGFLKAQLDQFEYVRSDALQTLQRSDTSLAFCDFNRLGVCKAPSYLVLSQIRRFAVRDAELLVFAVDSGSMRHLRVRLRYHRGAWLVTGSQLAS